MKRKGIALALPQALLDEGGGGAAGTELFTASTPALDPEAMLPERDEEDPRVREERVHELVTALLREHLARHSHDATELRDAFELAFPRTASSVTRRSVMMQQLGLSQSDLRTTSTDGSTRSIIEGLVDQLVSGGGASGRSRPSTATQDSPAFATTPSPARTQDVENTVEMQASMRFNVARDGCNVDINGLDVGREAHSARFTVKHVDELELGTAATLGKGAGGRVVKARHRPTGRYFAVKEIMVGSDDIIKQVEAEISVLWGTANANDQALQPCENLIECRGVFYSDGLLYVVMDLMLGSLKDALDHYGCFSEAQARAVAFQTLRGLEYMHHEKRQLHRDIKPHNILVDARGVVKVSDFGIASERVETWNQNARATFCGTLVYMSPNRAEGLSYSYEADMWSLGVTLYQVVVGRMPAANNLFDVIAMRTSPPRLPTDRGYSADMCDFVARLLDPAATAATQTVNAQALLDHPWLQGMSLAGSKEVLRPVVAAMPVVADGEGLGGKAAAQAAMLSDLDAALM